MSEVKVRVDLDLDTSKADGQLKEFQNSAKDKEIPVKLDIENIKGEALHLKNILSDAFKMDSKTLGNLKQVEDSLKQINKLIKSQHDLSGTKLNNKSDILGVDPIRINKDADIVKDINVLMKEYWAAAQQLDDLDAVGQLMKASLDSFNQEQEEAFRKFSNESKSYDKYLNELQGDNITKALKKAIDARKKSIQLQEELTRSGVVKVNNDQLRNEKADGSIFTIENEKWRAMFARSESEAKELEDLARKLQPKIKDANNKVEELMKEMSEGERKLLSEFSKAFEQRPQFDKISSSMDNADIDLIKMYLEKMMPDVDKMGLDFNRLDDVFRGLNRFYSRLEQMQKEYNTKFAGEEGFKPMKMESLLAIEQDDIKKIINEAEQNNNLLEDIFQDRNRLSAISDNSRLTESSVNESVLRNMEEFIRLSRMMNQVSDTNQPSSNVTNSVREYLALSKAIDEVQTKLYKAGVEGKDAMALSQELELLERKRNQLNDLVNINSEYMQQELRLQQARKDSNVANIDSNEKIKALKEESRLRKELAKEEEKLRKNAEAQRDRSVKEYLATAKKISDIESAIYRNEKSDTNTEETNNSLREQIALLRERQAVLSMDIRAKGDINEDIKRQIEYQEKLQKAIRDTRNISVDENVNSKATKQLEKTYQELDKIQDKLTSMQNTKGFLDNEMVERTNALLSETRAKLDANGIESDFKEINQAINLLGNNLQSLNTGNTLSRQEANFNVSLQNMENRLESFKNSIKDLRGADEVIERLESAFRGIDTSNIERATVDLRQFGTELQQAQREMRQLDTNGRRFFGNFGQEFRDNLFTFTAGELLADGIRNVAYSLKTIVMEYDTAMTNLKKVADPSDIMNIQQLDAIEQKAVSIAKNVGQSSQDVIQAIADTTQMGGYGMEQATMIAEQTMMLANVAELTQEVASKGVVTMMSAFNLDPLRQVPVVVNGVTQSTDELTNSMDKLNYVGNNFAVSSGGLLDAITSGANVLASYNVSMNDTLAMIAASNTTLQDTSRVGNGLKTIAVNLAGIKASADTGQLSLNKTAKTLKEVANIDVYSDKKNNQLKGMSELITELATKWEGFNDVQKAGISEAVAGKQQAAVFQSLMQNYDVMKKVQDELGSGQQWQSMERENAQYIDSIAGKLNTLKETWVGIFNTIFSSDATKSIIDGLVSISEAIANVITMLDETNMLTPVLMGLGAMLASKAFTGLPNLFRNGERSARGFSNILPRMAEGLGNFGLMGTRAGVALYGVQGALGTATTATTGFLATAAKFIPWATAAVVATGGLIWVYDQLTESLDEEKDRLNETISTRKSEIASIEEQKGKLQGLQKEYDTLANKPKKTADEVKRLNELTKQIAEIRPDLVVAYDENNNPILSMTGDVQDLIEEMDRATESKKRLLSVEQGDLAVNSIKQLHGSGNGRLESEGYRPDTEMNKLEDLTTQHVAKMSSLESKRDKLLNKLYDSTGKERQKILKDLEKANYNIEKQQSDFAMSYQQQLDVVKEYSDKIGEGIFASLESGSTFKNMDAEMQKSFSSIKQSLDFTDIKTEDQLLEVEMSLNNLLKACANGDVDINNVSKALENANKEFAKNGDAEKYSKNIEKIISDLEAATGKDFSMLKDVFEGIDTSILKGKDALDEFLRAYGKTKADLDKNDGFAKALANQKRQIEQAIDELNSVTGDAEIDLELAYNIVNNEELPRELRDMVRVLINKGENSTEVVKLAQELLVDISDGNINIDEANEKIKEKFGEGAFEITPEILMSDSAKVAGVETVINQLNERFGEVPAVVKTVIEAEGITAFNSAVQVKEMYEEIPKEVKTVMSNNGVETLADIINVNNMLDILPSDIVMNVLTNFPDVVQGASSVEEIISSLPPSVLMEIQSNYPEVVEGSQLIQDAIENIPATKESTVSVKEEIQKSPSGIFDKLFGKNQSNLTATAVVKAQVENEQALTNVENKINQLTTNGKSVSIKGDTSDIDKKTQDTQSKVDNIKQKSPTKVNVDNISANNRLKTTKGHLDEIKSKSVTVTVNTKYTTTGTKPSTNGGGHWDGQSLSEQDYSNQANKIGLLSPKNGDNFNGLDVSSMAQQLHLSTSDLQLMNDAVSSFDVKEIAKANAFASVPVGGTPNATYVGGNVEFNSPLIVIEGNVDEKIMPDLKKAMQDLKKEITKDMKINDVRKKRLEGR